MYRTDGALRCGISQDTRAHFVCQSPEAEVFLESVGRTHVNCDNAACRRRRWDNLLRRVGGRQLGVASMSDEPKKQSWAWISWVAVMLVAYPLSMGPVLRYAKRTDVPLAVYEPRLRLCDACSPLDAVKDRYMRLWKRGILNCKIPGRSTPARSVVQP
jgi:hypothetical protein